MKLVSLASILLFLCCDLLAQSGWELKKDEDGIKVFTRNVAGSDISEFKAEALMEGKLSNFVAVMRDVENYDKLFSNQKEPKLLTMSDTAHVHYVITDTPWPLSDREGVYRNVYKQKHNNKTIIIDVNAIKGFVKENNNYVRMYKAIGHWQFVQVDNSRVMVTFQMHAEPEGNIPGWIINMFIVDSPLKDFQNLRERVKLKQYANQRFDFLTE